MATPSIDLAEKALSELCAQMRLVPPKLTHSGRDKRQESAHNEEEVAQHISIVASANPFFTSNELSVDTSSHFKEWFDVAIVGPNNLFVPVNIKVTEENGADNLNCKLGIYYALTGLLPDFNNGVVWETYLKKLHTNLPKPVPTAGTDSTALADIDADYFFLVVTKTNPKNSFFNRLKALQELTANGNNLPFQCNWTKNHAQRLRTESDARQFILKVFGSSILKRSALLTTFNTLFPGVI